MAQAPIEVEDEGDGGEGGAGGGAASGAVDEKRLANLANAAVSGHLKRALPKAIAEALAPFMEQLAARGAPPAGGAPPGGAPQGGAPTGGGDDKYAALEKKFQESEKARVAERAQGHRSRAYDGVRGALAGKARPDAIEAALKVLKADDRIGVGEDGTPFIKDGDEELSLEEGVKRFMKSKEGALFAPAPTTTRRAPPQKLNARSGKGEEPAESPAARSLRMIEGRRAKSGG